MFLIVCAKLGIFPFICKHSQLFFRVNVCNFSGISLVGPESTTLQFKNYRFTSAKPQVNDGKTTGLLDGRKRI